MRPKKRPRPFGHVGDPEAGPGARRAAGEILAVEQDAARQRVDDAGDRPQRGRLAGAVGTEQGDHLAGGDGQVEAAHDRGPVVAGGESPSSARQATGVTALRRGASRRCDLGGGRPEVGGDDPRVPAHLVGLAARDHLAELEHDDLVGDAEHEAHVVVDEQHRRAGVDDLAQAPAELGRLVDVEAGGGLVQADQPRGSRRGRGRPRRPCAAPWVSSSGISSATVLEAEQSERVVDSLRVHDGPREHLAHRLPQRRAVGGDHQVLEHREVVEQLDRLPRPVPARAGRARAPAGG